MKIKALEGFNRAEVQLVIDTLRLSMKGKPEKVKKLTEISLNKVIDHGANADLDGMEMKQITRSLMNKALMLHTLYGIESKKTEKKLMYNLAHTISMRLIAFQREYGPSIEKIEKAQTAVTVHAS
ncbi:hypothetical protein [Bacillus sp. JCM 19034]|uniref:hypothetical protein n=1 Tax=Bacillus sp. JCM 19034 TaxID=1481928 RepID=UPI0007819A75|nr:hypothetical protein [Bacillus sp. JCM 19034]